MQGVNKLIPKMAAAAMLLILNTGAATIQSQLSGKIDLIVAPDGSGDYQKIQDAINSIPDDNIMRKVIFVKEGTYKEKIVLPIKKTNITLVGESVDKCIISNGDHSSNTVEMNTFSSYTFRADADDFYAMNLTIENTSAKQGQAVALHANGDRQMYLHCKLLGWQDTYYNNLRSRHYLKDCFIEGATDFIFGFGVELFDDCLINTINSGGQMTAGAAASKEYRFGYVFRNCKLTCPSNISSFVLGRPWWDYARTVIFKSWEHPNLSSAGWSGWGGREKTCYYREYKCTGGGFKPNNRQDWAGQLTDQEAASYELDTIFSHLTFPQGQQAATAEIEFILNRWTNPPTSNYMIQIAKDVIKRGMEDYPPIPTDDWKPRPDTDAVYAVIKSNFAPFLDSGQFVPIQKEPLYFSEHPNNLLQHNSITDQLGLKVTAGSPDRVKLNIFNLTGKQVLRRELSPVTQSRGKVWFDVSPLKRGVYIYKANSEGIEFRGKFDKKY